MKINIQQLIYWKLKTANKEQGFITLEVILALIVGLAFFAFSLQSYGAAMVIKAQAQEKQRANELIQEDIERISQLGSTPLTPTTLPSPTPVCNPVATAVDNSTVPPTPAYTAYQNSYANALWNALVAAAPEGDVINNTTLKTLVQSINTDGTTQIDGKTLGLRRFYVSNTNSTAPHRTLEVGYQVWEWNGGIFTNSSGLPITANDQPIAETYVEIIPDVALSCP